MSRELMQQVLTEYLNREMPEGTVIADPYWWAIRIAKVIDSALAKPEQESVAVWELQSDGWNTIADPDWMESLPFGTKLYASPPRKEWVSLTDHQIDSTLWIGKLTTHALRDFAHAIEAKLKERNT